MTHDPGGKVKLPLTPLVNGRAKFSKDLKYRHWLIRDARLPGTFPARTILWIGMNPSTATAHTDDPTIRKEQHISWAHGFDRMVKCNAMDYRCTDSHQLVQRSHFVKLASPKNLEWIQYWAEKSDTVVFAWGKLPKELQPYADKVIALLTTFNPMCIGKNPDGSPKHPLYQRNDSTLTSYFGGNNDPGR